MLSQIRTSQGQSRRSFIRTAMALGGAVAALPLLSQSQQKEKEDSKILIGSQLYGWGQYYQREGKNLNDNLGEVFSALRDAGYDYAEGSLDLSVPENNAAIAEQAKQKGLRPFCIYSGGALHLKDQWEKNVQNILQASQVCSKSGYKILNCNPDPIGREKTDEELITQARGLDLLGAELLKMGMKLAVHNHTPEMINNAREFRWNFDQTESSKTGFCFDVHWVYRGGMSPIEALEKYGSRVESWHLRQSREGVWWEDLDSGDIDYLKIASIVKQKKLPRIYTVELALENGTKITRSAAQNHRRSIEYVRKVLA
ncbi:MAG: sugar phosphate isomerase/epimerase family protein [Verrucomicrobiales bacterium]